jgi:hypothetical protein
VGVFVGCASVGEAVMELLTVAEAVVEADSVMMEEVGDAVIEATTVLVAELHTVSVNVGEAEGLIDTVVEKDDTPVVVDVTDGLRESDVVALGEKEALEGADEVARAVNEREVVLVTEDVTLADTDGVTLERTIDARLLLEAAAETDDDAVYDGVMDGDDDMVSTGVVDWLGEGVLETTGLFEGVSDGVIAADVLPLPVETGDDVIPDADALYVLRDAVASPDDVRLGDAEVDGDDVDDFDRSVERDGDGDDSSRTRTDRLSRLLPLARKEGPARK